MVAWDAILQGVVAAVAVIGVAIIYIERITSISSDINRIADSLEDIDDTNFEQIANSVEHIDRKVAEVDLKDMEKATNKMKFWIENQQGGQSGANNSVVYDLTNIDNIVTISFVGVENTVESDDDERTYTVIEFEFDDQIDSRDIADKMSSDSEIAEMEHDLFGGEPNANATSPYEISFRIPSTDIDAIADWIPSVVKRIERYQRETQEQRRKFDAAVEDSLERDL